MHTMMQNICCGVVASDTPHEKQYFLFSFLFSLLYLLRCSSLFICTSIFFFISQAVGKEHHTLIFDIKNTKLLPTNSVQQTSLYVCIAGDVSQQIPYGCYIKETFRLVFWLVFVSNLFVVVQFCLAIFNDVVQGK